ncbi:hypothetical protein [Methanobacterium sp. ACI-7]|uniref:hypothetical protein n=1 Tax=unclassified Methanobacterium TaxID=2627676 RepID=UPI0039C2C77F
MISKIEEFLNSPEYNAWEISFKEVLESIKNETINGDQENELINNLHTNHLFASIKLGSYYHRE